MPSQNHDSPFNALHRNQIGLHHDRKVLGRVGKMVPESPSSPNFARSPPSATGSSFKNSDAPKNLAMRFASETGELLAEYRSVPNTDSDAHSAAPDSRARIAAEIGDVGIALTLLCDRIGVDLCAAMSDKLAQNRLRYPPDKSRGKATRPDDA